MASFATLHYAYLCDIFSKNWEIPWSQGLCFTHLCFLRTWLSKCMWNNEWIPMAMNKGHWLFLMFLAESLLHLRREDPNSHLSWTGYLLPWAIHLISIFICQRSFFTNPCLLWKGNCVVQKDLKTTWERKWLKQKHFLCVLRGWLWSSQEQRRFSVTIFCKQYQSINHFWWEGI